MKTILGLLTGICISLPLPVLAVEGLAWMKNSSVTVRGVTVSEYYCLHYKSTNTWFPLNGITDAIVVSGTRCDVYGIQQTNNQDYIAPIGQPNWFNTIKFDSKYVKDTWVNANN